jgi:Fur family iron response transcriptional regulator
MQERHSSDSQLEFPVELEARLRSLGIYPTPQRLMIAQSLLPEHQHVTAEQLHERLRKRSVGLSKATVYNTLGLFVQKGLLREVFVDNARTFYDSNTQPHYHFYNLDTGTLTDIDRQRVHFNLQHELPAGTRLDSAEVIIRVRNLDA